MTRIAVSRRKLLEAGACAMAGAAAFPGDGKRARRDGVEHDNRRNHPEVV